MKFFSFRQNNSGGRFVQNDNLDVVVVVEAKSPVAANKKAEKVGMVFDGVSKGCDCECCGDRWMRQWKSDEGFDSVDDAVGFGNAPAVVHFADGRVQKMH